MRVVVQYNLMQDRCHSLAMEQTTRESDGTNYTRIYGTNDVKGPSKNRLPAKLNTKLSKRASLGQERQNERTENTKNTGKQNCVSYLNLQPKSTVGSTRHGTSKPQQAPQQKPETLQRFLVQPVLPPRIPDLWARHFQPPRQLRQPLPILRDLFGVHSTPASDAPNLRKVAFRSNDHHVHQ